MPTNYNDGAWTTGIQTGADLVTYPFLDYPIPDVYARKYQSSIAILPANYQPSIANRTTYTNLLTYSEALTNAAWTALNNTVTDNVTTNPMDGQTTMSRFIETVTNGEHRIAHAITFTAVPTTLYCFIRGGLGRTNFYLRANDGTNSFSGFFDISTTAGSVGTLSNATGVIYAMGDGSYLIAITFTPAAAGGNVYLNVASSGSVISYAGDTAKGMYVWGVDVKAQSAVTPYVSTTNVARAISSPDWYAPAVSFTGIPDPFAFEVDETDLVISDLARAKFVVAYARIPAPQTVYSTIAVTKPTPANLGITVPLFLDFTANNYLPVQLGLANSAFEYLGYLWGNNQLYTQTSAVGVLTPAGSGQFTITFGASTTGALNYNAASGTINSAVNGLASVIAASLTVSCVNNLTSAVPSLSINITSGTTLTQFTMSAVSVNAGEYPFTVTVSSTIQEIFFGYKTVITSHGFSTSGNLAAYFPGYGAHLLAYGTGWYVIDANTISIFGPQNVSGLTVSAAGKLYRAYTPGVDRLRTKRVTSFYLPGVTTGITTPADIPVPDPALNDAVFLSLVITYLTGFQTYDADPLQQWIGPIYQQTLTQIDMATV